MLAVSLGLAVILALEPESAMKWFPVLLGSLLMYGLGLWDDLKPLGARIKFAGQVATAVLVYKLGLSIERVNYPGGAWSVELGAWSLPVTVFWLIAVPNIVNLIDGFDGLATGLGVFLAATLGIVGLHNEQLAVAWFAFTMAGALLGFLVFNFPPAKIFLGDGGAYFIGFCIAALSLTSANKGSVAAVLLLTIVALGLPILDTIFAILRRAVRGFPIFHADNEHIHHKLASLGFSKRRVLLAIYGLCVMFSLLGLSVVWSQGRTLPIGFGAIFLLAAGMVRYFHFSRSWTDLLQRVDRLGDERRLVQYALLQAQVLELEVERCREREEFWLVFHQTMHRVGFLATGGDETSISVQLRYSGEDPLVLHAPIGLKINGEDARREWQRIAECFRPAFVKAQAKWSS